MNMEDQVREAMVQELTRQAEAGDGKLKVTSRGNDLFAVEGEVDMDALAMAVVGAVAGGP